MIDKLLFTLKGIRPALARCGVFALALSLLIMGQAVLLTLALTNLWHGQPLADQVIYIAGFAACFLVRQLVENVQSKWLDAFSASQADHFRERLLKKSYAAGQPLVQREGTGNFVTLLIEGVDQVEAYLRMVLPRMTRLVIIPVLLLVLIFALDWVSGVIALLVFPAIILQMVLIGYTAGQEAGKQHTEYQRLANHFIDSLRGIDTLKLFGRSHDQAKRIFTSSEKFREATMKTLRIATLSGAVLDAFSTISIAAIAVMLGFRLVDGSLTLFPALLVLVLIPDYFKPIREFASDYHASLNGKTALASLVELVGTDEAKGDGGSKAAVPNTPADNSDLSAPSEDAARSAAPDTPTTHAAPAWNATSTLRLEDVTFRYATEAPNPADAPAALQHITCTLSGFSKVGIVGASGSGKSTLAHLLAGIIAPQEGAISVSFGSGGATSQDDAPQSEDITSQNASSQLKGANALQQPAWRSQVSYIPQNPHIFHATLRENLAFYQPDASEDALNEVVSLMGLENLVEDLPHGLDTVIGEGAQALSGGQAQRIAFARAFLNPACRVLIFDEPTAHLDIETELELKEHMLSLMDGKLVLFATHRLHWLSSMDTILFVDQGRLVAQGSLEQLKENDSFAQFIAQSRGFAVRQEGPDARPNESAERPGGFAARQDTATQEEGGLTHEG